MTFNEVIKEFMRNIEINKTDGTFNTYKRKIYVFQEYINIILQEKYKFSKYFDCYDKRIIGRFNAILC